MHGQYLEALTQARKQLAELEELEKNITFRKAQLRTTIEGLASLCSEAPGIADLPLAEAIRVIFRSSDESYNATDLRDKLQDIGYDLARFKNPLASIHTAIKRMVEAEELSWVDNKVLESGEKMKDPPSIPQGLADLLGTLPKIEGSEN